MKKWNIFLFLFTTPYVAIIMSWADNCHKWTKFAHYQSQTRPPQYQCTHQVWWKCIEIYSSYCTETKIPMCHGQTTLSNIEEICWLAIPKQISTISIHIESFLKNPLTVTSYHPQTKVQTFWADNSAKFCENPLIFTEVIVQKQK